MKFIKEFWEEVLSGILVAVIVTPIGRIFLALCTLVVLYFVLL